MRKNNFSWIQSLYRYVGLQEDNAAKWDGQETIPSLPILDFAPRKNTYYYGYKSHAICGLSEVIHSYDLSKARKRIETLFSQLTEQFLVIRNYAKITNGLFARIIGKISALTVLQHINFINNKTHREN